MSYRHNTSIMTFAGTMMFVSLVKKQWVPAAGFALVYWLHGRDNVEEVVNTVLRRS